MTACNCDDAKDIVKSSITNSDPGQFPEDLRVRNLRADIANTLRSFKKNWFGRGPKVVHVDFFGPLIIVRCEEVLAKHEARIAGKSAHQPSTHQVLDFRSACFDRGKADLVARVRASCGIEVLDASYGLLLAVNESVYVLRLKAPLLQTAPLSKADFRTERSPRTPAARRDANPASGE